MPITDLATNVILDNVGKVYFLKTGVYRDPVGLDNNHPLSSVSAMLIHIEDGVPQNVMLANYAPSKMASWASHDFPLWYRGQVEYTVAGESAPRTFAQYFTYVPSILVAMNKNGASIMDVNVTITQNTGANLLGGFANLTALNAEFPPTEELSDDVATAYVYDSGTKGFYRVAWDGVSAWEWTLITQALVTYGVQTKQYNVLPIKVQRGYAPSQTPLTVSDEVIRLIYQEIAYINAVIANHAELIDELDTDIVNHLADFDNPHQVTALQLIFDNSGSDIVATDVESAIKEVNTKANANEQDILDLQTNKEDKSNKATAWGTPDDIKYPTTKLVDDRLDPIETFKDTTVPATYETIANADTHRGRTTALENANMIKSIARTGTNLFTLTFYDNTTSNILTLAELKAFIGEATQSLSGLMSATDKTELDTLVALFDSDADDVVNTIAEILAIFEDYPEGVDLVTALAGKVDKTQIVNDLTTGGATDVLSAEQGKTLQDTKEAVANKKSVINDSETEYPNSKAVRNYVRDIGLDTPITQLNNHTLREVFEEGDIATNGNFASTTGWVASSGVTRSVSNNELVLTLTSTGGLRGVYKIQEMGILNTKYYFIVDYFAKYNEVIQVGFSNTPNFLPKSLNEWNEKTLLVTGNGVNTSPILYFNAIGDYEVGDTFKFRNFKVIELNILEINNLGIDVLDMWYEIYKYIKSTSTTQFLIESAEKLLKSSIIETIVTVKKTGGDYNTLRECFSTIKPTFYERYVVELYEGDWVINDEYTTEEWGEEGFLGLFIPDYVTLKGIGRREEIVISATDGTIDLSTLNIANTANLENLTITGDTLRYVIHDDFSSLTQSFKTYERNVTNCMFIGTGMIGNSVYGAGQREGGIWKFTNCIFNNTDGTITFSDHNNTFWTKESSITFDNCRFISGSGDSVLRLGSLTTNANDVFTRVTLKGCKMDELRLIEESAGTYGTGILFTISGYANVITEVNILNTDEEDYSSYIDLI